jgi:hypothetical protein
LFLCFYFNSFFFFGVFRHYQYYFHVPQPVCRVPPEVCVPRVGNHWSRSTRMIIM